jgi:hypothetical protein
MTIKVQAADSSGRTFDSSQVLFFIKKFEHQVVYSDKCSSVVVASDIYVLSYSSSSYLWT